MCLPFFGPHPNINNLRMESFQNHMYYPKHLFHTKTIHKRNFSFWGKIQNYMWHIPFYFQINIIFIILFMAIFPNIFWRNQSGAYIIRTFILIQIKYYFNVTNIRSQIPFSDKIYDYLVSRNLFGSSIYLGILYILCFQFWILVH